MKQSAFIFVVPILLLISFLGFNFGAQRYLSGIAIDATQDRIFTLSSATKELIEKSQGQIVFDFYYSKHAGNENPILRLYGSRVRDVLKSYARTSKGKIIFREHDAAPFSIAEDNAIAANLIPWRDNVGAVSPIYLGLVASFANQKAYQNALSIEAFRPEKEASLEYDISRLIVNLNNPKNPIIGVISDIDWFIDSGTLGLRTTPNSQIAKDISNRFELVSLANDFDRLPPKMDALLIAQPFDLNEFQQYLIDQYVVNGGRVLLAQDPASSISYDNKTGKVSSINSLGRLSINWGFTLSGEIVADKNNALLVQSKLGDRDAFIPQPLYFAISENGLNRDQIITSSFARGINVATPGAIIPNKTSGLEFEPIAKSSNQSMLIDKNTALDSPTPQEISSIWNPSGEEYIIAALIRGQIKSAFPNGPPLAPIRNSINKQIFGEAAKIAPHQNSTKNAANIIVVSDVDFLSDGLFMQSQSPSADNSDFVINALEFLSGDSALVELRSKAKFVRTLNTLDDLGKEAQTIALENQTRLESELRNLQSQIEENEALGLAFNSLENKQIRKEIAQTRAELRKLEGARLQKTAQLKIIIIAICAGLIPVIILIIGIYQIQARRKLSKSANI